MPGTQRLPASPRNSGRLLWGGFCQHGYKDAVSAEFDVPTFRERCFVCLKQYREALGGPIALALGLARPVNAPESPTILMNSQTNLEPIRRREVTLNL
jgi:hypothetical protein